MSDTAPTLRTAWQPFTFGGVAAFATASWRRTLALNLVGATICGLMIVAGFRFGWLPVIDAAVDELPEKGEIQHASLAWEESEPRVLAKSSLLQIVVNPSNSARFGDESDLRVELRADDFLVCGWLGCWSWPYPTGWIIAVNRPEVLPAWGAWRPFAFWGVFFGGSVWVFVSWVALSVLGAAPLRAAAFYLDREVSLSASARILMAAWIPGGLFFALALFLYGVQQLHVVALAVIGLTHVLMGMIYAVAAITRLPQVAISVGVPGANPFQSAPSKLPPRPPATT